MHLPEEYIDALIDIALAKNITYADIATEIIIGPRLQGKASILVKEKGVLAGSKIAERAFLNVDPSLHVTMFIQDGVEVKPGDIVADVSGFFISIVKAGRVAINFLQSLSGIVSQRAQRKTKTGVRKVNIANASIATPDPRLLKEYALSIGGGQNHYPFHIGHSILITDNHLTSLGALGMSFKDSIYRAKQNAPQGLKVEVEVNTVQAALDAAKAGADIIMVDNLSLEEVRRIVKLASGQVKSKASGGTSLDNILAIAIAGVDIISIGAIDHPPKALDISLELEPQNINLL